MKKLFIFLSLLGVLSLSSILKAQSIEITDSTKFSLLTCSPGPLAYEKFGHTAIRIYDETQSTDFIANWGLFDFSKPGFYYKFVKGETYYLLGLQETSNFLYSYYLRNSSVTEQVLNLTNEEKQVLFDAIVTNYLPENREYLYNFVFDNCATRARDLIIDLFKGSEIEYNLSTDEKTYREWVASYAGEKSWLMFGIDLVFGKDADKVAPRWYTMFLPEVLHREFANVTLKNNKDEVRSLVSFERVLVESKEKKAKSIDPFQPLVITTVILLLGVFVTFYELKKKKHFRVVDSLLMLITGLAGVIIFYLMFFSIHPLVKINFNILWCNPLNIIVGVLMLLPKFSSKLKWVQVVNMILFLFAMLVFTLSVQAANIAFLPLVALLLVRAVAWLQRINKSSKSNIFSNK